MPWLALSYSEQHRKQELSGRFNVQGIPTLVLVAPDGRFTTDGRRLVGGTGAAGYPWITGGTAATKTEMQKSAMKLESSTPVPATAVAGAKDAMVSLKDLIDVGKSTVLNNDTATELKSILKTDGVLKSDADTDAQLLLYITFREAVKIRGISFAVDAKANASANESGPKTVKVFVDRSAFDFSEAASLPPTQTFVLAPSDFDGREKLTQFVKFQSVHTLTVFIESNQRNTAVTVLNRLSFIGTANAGMRVSEIKKIEGQ